MVRVRGKIRWLKKYLKKTGRLRTLDALSKDLKMEKNDERKSSELSSKIQKKTERKNKEDRPKKKKEKEKEAVLPSLKENEKKVEAKTVKLSFTIQKAPERKKIEIEPPKPKKKERTKDVEEPKNVEVPKEFKKIAKKFGLPEDHLEFFYEHRDSFNWEMKKEFVVHCSERGCKLIVNEARGCLNEHMISVHDYKDIPCGKIDCAFIAYSQKTLKMHHSKFHGHGQKPTKDARLSCPYSSCKCVCKDSHNLRNHVNIHRNIVFSCNFCPFRAVQYKKLSLHLKSHFNIRDSVCEICSSSFATLSRLNEHKIRTHNNDGFACEDCDFSCMKNSQYVKHRKSCTERLKHSRIL